MIFRAPTPKNPTLHVMEDKFFLATVNRQDHFLHIIRSAETFAGGDEARLVHQNLGKAVQPYVRFRVLIDLRKAKGSTNPAVELAIREVWFPVLGQFHPLAVVVATAAGRLHVARMFREHGFKGKVFMTEPEAFEHLGLGEPPLKR